MAHLEELREHWGLKRMVVIGHASGAAHTMLLADRTPIARKRVVVDAGRRPWIEQPEAVGELLIEIVRAETNS